MGRHDRRTTASADWRAVGLLTAWLAYTFVKDRADEMYRLALSDIRDIAEEYSNQPTQPHTHYQLINGELVDIVTGEILELPKTTEVTDEMQETADARHEDLTTKEDP